LYHKQQLESAKGIISGYDGKEPFHLYLKKYYSRNKKHGSRDRKNITSLCYNFFRIGKAMKDASIEEKILTGVFLTHTTPDGLLELLKPEWNKMIVSPLKEKFSVLNQNQLLTEIFPYEEELSERIEREKMSESILIQPKLYIRIRPGYKEKVIGKLESAGISYEMMGDSCIGFENSTKIESVIELDKEAVVQDYNSQQVGELLNIAMTVGKQTSVWDCCAGSGGKSILAHDINPAILLTVSDNRESILKNLEERFETAGIKDYNAFVTDLFQKESGMMPSPFDLIIADVPCTGSGTWSRTPEQLYYFDKNTSAKYSERQKHILTKVIPHLAEGGQLLYITCSVFKKENEEVVQFVMEKFGLTLREQKLYKGYDMRADSLFAALLSR
jgi:16S rRNA (cytosine967-C5)-methyltransferase